MGPLGFTDDETALIEELRVLEALKKANTDGEYVIPAINAATPDMIMASNGSAWWSD